MKKYLETTEAINNALTAADPLFEKLIARCGNIKIKISENCFQELVSSIVGQQLSNRVAEVIWGRVAGLLKGDIRAETILGTGDEEFRKTGMSYSKIRYIKNLSEAVLANEIRPEEFGKMTDEEIIKTLTKVKGIGNWTAEMILIFSLGRPDVFSLGDGGLQRAVKELYGFDEVPGKQQLLEISGKWKPYRTYASLYLWKSLNN